MGEQERIRVLIIDDTVEMRGVIKRLLMMVDDEFELVAEAGDGEEGLRLVQECLPDVVLVDHAMPGMTGVDVTRRVKTLPQCIAVVMLTVYRTSDFRDDALAAGVFAYLTKPLEDFEAFFQTLRDAYQSCRE